MLLCEQLRLVQLNSTARDIVGWLNGERTVRQVAEVVAQAHDQPFEPVLADLETQGVVERRLREWK